MADQSQLSFLLQGVEAWNEWWKEWFERNPRSSPPTVDFSGASLLRADLSGALLGMADLTRANLSGADLSEQIEQATGNEQTKLPKHLKPPASWSQGSHDQQTGDK